MNRSALTLLQRGRSNKDALRLSTRYAESMQKMTNGNVPLTEEGKMEFMTAPTAKKVRRAHDFIIYFLPFGNLLFNYQFKTYESKS